MSFVQNFAASLHRIPHPSSIAQTGMSTHSAATALAPPPRVRFKSEPRPSAPSTKSLPSLIPTNLDLTGIVNNFPAERISQVLERGLAKSTRAGYTHAVNIFTNFCNAHAVPAQFRFPTHELVICTFVSSLAETLAGSSISGILSGLKMWHTANNMPWLGGPRLPLLIRGATAMAPLDLKRPQRAPVTVDMIAVLATDLDTTSPLGAAVFAAASSSFWGQCRLGEMVGSSRLQHDPSRFPSRDSLLEASQPSGSRELILPRTKTSQRTGERVVLLRQIEPVDPIAAIENHLRVNNSLKNSDHLFAYITVRGTVHCLTAELMLSTCNDAWRKKGFPPVTGHAFRIGGTTALLRNKVPPDVVKEMGRWTSDAFLRYWRDRPAIAALHAELLPLKKHEDPRLGAAPPSSASRSRAPAARMRTRHKGRPYARPT